MNIKLLFHPKQFIHQLPDNKISIKLILWLVGFYLITILLNLFTGYSKLLNQIAEFNIQYAHIGLGTKLFGGVVAILLMLLSVLVIVTIVILATKLILKLFHRSLTLKNIINLFVYRWIIKFILIVLIGVIILLALKLVNLTGETSPIIQRLHYLNPNELNNLVYNIINIPATILSYIFYVCIINLASKREQN
ncbi:MAG: hypothetical protein WC659_04820 [Patescibacteria group bacterium]